MRTLVPWLLVASVAQASDVVIVDRIGPRSYRLTRSTSYYVNAVGPNVGKPLRMAPSPWLSSRPRSYRKRYDLNAIAKQRQRERYGYRDRLRAR